MFFSEQRLKSFLGNSGLPDPRSTQKKCMKTERLYSGLPDFVDRFLVMFSFVLHFLLHPLNVETFFLEGKEIELQC